MHQDQNESGTTRASGTVETGWQGPETARAGLRHWIAAKRGQALVGAEVDLAEAQATYAIARDIANRADAAWDNEESLDEAEDQRDEAEGRLEEAQEAYEDLLSADEREEVRRAQARATELAASLVAQAEASVELSVVDTEGKLKTGVPVDVEFEVP